MKREAVASVWWFCGVDTKGRQQRRPRPSQGSPRHRWVISSRSMRPGSRTTSGRRGRRDSGNPIFCIDGIIGERSVGCSDGRLTRRLRRAYPRGGPGNQRRRKPPKQAPIGSGLSGDNCHCTQEPSSRWAIIL